jgi:O-antigen/teichoic acid export membrane protein
MASSVLASDQRLAASIGKNTLFGVISSAVQVGTRFVMVPVVIYHLGLDGYGIWAVVMAAAGYMRFGSAGLKSAFQKYVAEATGTGDFRTANQLLSTGSLSMLLLSLAGLIPLGFYSQSLARAGGVPPAFLHAAAGSITLLAVIMVLANFGSVFEASVSGAHRIDLTRKFTVLTTTGEAVAIITLLHFGYGLFAMAATMAVSELLYVVCCFWASRRIIPEIHISAHDFTPRVFRELIRFAGSYQLVNVLEVLYGMILPVIVLRHFGANMAGVYAVATRLVIAALIGVDALILPLLSGGTVTFASGSIERINRFLRKSFKITLAASLLPLAFVAAFGTLLVQVWTGEVGPEFRMAVWLTCFSALFASISRVQLVLYRASGNALHDNIRQAFRLGVLILLAELGSMIGFYGVLVGLVVAEFVGVVYMFFAMKSVLRFFAPKSLMPDTLRLATTIGAMIAVGEAVAVVPIPWGATERVASLIRLAEVVTACAIAAWPAAALTKSISREEQRLVLKLVTPLGVSEALPIE